MSIRSTFEAQWLQLGPEHSPNRLDARQVQRAAVLVDPFLEHGDGACLLGIDGADHRLLGRAEPGEGRRGEAQGEGGNQGLNEGRNEGRDETQVHGGEP